MPATTGADLAGDGVAEFRLTLAAVLFAWSPARVKAYRQGYRDGSADRFDEGRCGAHQPDDGYDEATLTSAQVDALGYMEGMEAGSRANRHASAQDWDAEEAREYALSWSDQADDTGRARAAEWFVDMAGDTGRFLRIMTREGWTAWLVKEHGASLDEGRAGYADLLTQDIEEPVIVFEDDDVLDILDGWHRIAACMVRGSMTVPTVRGVAPAPTPMP